MRTWRLRVTLREVEPAVVRVLDVPEGVLLPELHDLLQAGLGWNDSHLHQFETEQALYGMPDVPGVDGPEHEQDESRVRLKDLPSGLVYRYDFGDDWEHDIELLGSGADRAGCVSGQGACPPEDCGGPPGYAELCETLADPADEDHEAMRIWVGQWRDQFDREATDTRVRQIAGAVPAPVQLLLQLTQGGVTLTPGGRLPRALVRRVQQHYPHWHPLADRPAQREDDVPPLDTLHELLRRVGLLRLRHGTVYPTRAANDPTQIIRRLRSWFTPDQDFGAILAGVTVAVLARRGPVTLPELAARVFPLLGGRWVTHDGQRLTEQHLPTQISSLAPELRALDLVATDPSGWSAGPSALWLLPRATLLAHILPDAA